MASEKLFELHSIDSASLDLRKKIAEARKRVENFQQSILRREQNRDKISRELRAQQVESKGIELQIETANDRKKSLEGKLIKLVKANEIQALQHEMQTLSEDVGNKETVLMEKYEAQEKTQAAIAAEDGEIKRRTAEVPKLKTQVAALLTDLEAQLANAEAMRAAVLNQIDAATQAKYLAARKRYPEGEILFEILDNSCGGCGMPGAGFEWNKLKQNPGNAYECSSCHRLLVYTGERLGNRPRNRMHSAEILTALRGTPESRAGSPPSRLRRTVCSWLLFYAMLCLWLSPLAAAQPAKPHASPSPQRAAASAIPASPAAVDDADAQLDNTPEPAESAAPGPHPSAHSNNRPVTGDVDTADGGTVNGNYVRDDAQVLPANVTAALTRKIRSVSSKVEIFIATKLLDDMSLFDQASQSTFRDILREVNHYRVIVIFIAYNRDRDHGIISTNLGHGIWHIVSKQDCEQLFGKEDAALTIDGIKSGVNRLVNIIKTYYENQPGTNTVSAPTFTGVDNLIKRIPFLIIGIAIGLIGFLIWRRGSNCPVCGAALKTRVSISLTSGPSGRIAKKTFKCFRCGYSHRQSLLPTGAPDMPRRPARQNKAEDDESIVTANEFAGLSEGEEAGEKGPPPAP